MGENTQHDSKIQNGLHKDEENRDWIYLIKPNGFTPDVVYKVFLKDNELYFCRVGGQFYGINEGSSLSALNTQEELLKLRRNYKIPRDGIASVIVDGKKSKWTGGIPNSGTLRFHVNDKKQKYIIHPEENPKKVADFFQKNCSCDVQVVNIENYENHQRELLEELEPQIVNESCKAALNISQIFNIVSLAVGLWLLLYPRPYLAAVFVNIAVVVTGGIFLIKYKDYILYGKNKYKDYISYGKKRLRKRPEFMAAILLASVALSLRASFDFNIFYSVPFWIFIAALSIFCTLLFTFKTKLHKKSKLTIGITLIVLFAFFYGTSVILNCRCDPSQPVKYQSKVLYMDTGAGKNIYYLTVSPWGSETKPVNLHIDGSLYNRIHIGNRVSIYQWKGLLSIPWVEIDNP